MSKHNTPHNANDIGTAVQRPEFLTEAQWRATMAALRLSPQQARVVALILQGKQDKEIAHALGLKKPTVRTYLSRVFARLGVTDRMGVALRVFAECAGLHICRSCHCDERQHR